jgi:hypothetical protein
VGGRTDNVKAGYRRAIPPDLSTHRTTPLVLIPSGSYVLSNPTVAEVVLAIVPRMVDNFIAAKAAIVTSFKRVSPLSNTTTSQIT